MSSDLRISRLAMVFAVLGALGVFCAGAPVPAAEPTEDDEISDAKIYATEMLEHRARLDLKTAFIIPTNSKWDVEVPFSNDVDGFEGVGGLKFYYESMKNVWFGLELDYARIQSKNPVVPGTSQSDLLSAKTENLIQYFDRIDVVATFDYDIVLGESIPHPEKPAWGFYSPILRLGTGLGCHVILPKESDGNTLIKIDDSFVFFWRIPSVAFIFPFHNNVGLFVQGDFDWVPYKEQMTGSINGENVDVGNAVEYSAFNLAFGFMIQW